MKTVVLYSFSLLAMGLPAGQGLAQSSEGETIVLETIYLESVKRPQEAFSFPGKVAQADETDLQNRNVTSVQDLDRVFGGLSIDMRSARPYSSFSLRGQSSLDFYNPSLGVYVDGIPQDAGSMAQFLPFGVETAELLYGPQGTLYGSGASGGVLNITTPKPGEGARFGYSLGGGNQSRSAHMRGEVQVAEGVWADLALGYVDEADHLTLPSGEDIGGSQSRNARLRFRIAPSDCPWDVMFTAQRSEISSDEEYFVPAGSFDTRQVLPYPSHYDQSVTTLGLTADYDLGWGIFTASTSYQNRDFDRKVFGHYTPETQISTTQEFRLASNGDRAVNYVIGTSLSKSDFTREAHGATIDMQTRKAALFGDLTWNVTDRLSVSPGLRYDWEQADVVSSGYGARYTAKDSWGALSPKLGASYAVSDTLQAYGLLSTGFQSGGFSRSAQTTAAVLSYDPQKVKNAEIGLRFASADGVINGSISAYYSKTEDLQMFVGTQPFQYLQNVGEAEAKGIDAELRYAANGWGLNLAAGYTDAKFTSYNNPLSPGVDLTGHRLPHVPEVTARIGVDYTFYLAGGHGILTPRLGVSYQSAVWFDEANSVGQGAYAIVDAGLTWQMENGAALDLNVNNLTDVEYAQYGFNLGGGMSAYSLGRGREVALMLRKSF